MVWSPASESKLLFNQTVTWSTTERREIRNFPYPSVFELTGRQRMTVKRGIRNVGQFLAAEVTNAGQNESQHMFALCDRMDKEGDILDRDSCPKESPDRVRKEKEAEWLARTLKKEVAFFFVNGNRKKSVLRTEATVRGRGIWWQTPGEEAEPGLSGQQFMW